MISKLVRYVLELLYWYFDFNLLCIIFIKNLIYKNIKLQCLCIKVNYYLLYKEILINIKNELYLVLLNVYYKKGFVYYFKY